MLLLHQAGSVKIGEVVRYTVSYTPANDRILPSPPYLYLKIKNTSAIALRAAFVHGPYTLYVSAAPKAFQANQKFENPRRDGVPEFEPNLKAGGTWHSQLSVPESVRKAAGSARRSTEQPHAAGSDAESVSWVIEIASQVIFSNSATVHYEILLGRDEKSLSLGFGGLTAGGAGTSIPGQVSDYQQSQGAKDGSSDAQSKGVFSRAIKLKLEDTASLWNKPRLPERDHGPDDAGKGWMAGAATQSVTGGNLPEFRDVKTKKQKKVHLVVLTHGLHSNLGADMLYMKENIDQAASKAKEDAKIRRAKRREEKKRRGSTSSERLRAKERTDRAFGTNLEGEVDESPAYKIEHDEDEDTDDEEVVVRGFSGNAVRTEKGIKYLGKRLAKYILSVTYPDQPFKPIRRSTSQSISNALKVDSSKSNENKYGPSVHLKSTVHMEPHRETHLPYKITSISFIAHSLGGLIQTYAVAYIQKHSPQFFDIIRPINFIAMATPFLGLSNENPLYVKFALDFGFVGRTGQDLGLTWRAPTLARSGWGAIVSGIGEGAHKKLEGEQDPGSKPLLRILPTGPAHTALKKFRNRTVYSNVVNDGIVPLRTSCLLFLDWQGLGRVEKARRENGLVGTMVGWGWAEVTGANASDRRPKLDGLDSDSMDDTETINTPTRQGHGDEVPLPAADETGDDNRSLKTTHTRPTSANSSLGEEDGVLTSPASPSAVTSNNGGALDSILGLFRAHPPQKPQAHIPKISKIYRRSQTIKVVDDSFLKNDEAQSRSKATSGENEAEDPNNLSAPPKTTFFEAAGDILNPPLPSVEFLIDPSSRPRTIFHDRVYHPEDIPPPPLKRRPTSALARRLSTGTPTSTGLSDDDSTFSSGASEVDGSAMKVEEKIARAYHRDMSWRKVLVRLEPDAHNNMIVRRKFANSYGWPVVKHLVDTHFSDQVVARMRDEDESSHERAKGSDLKPSKSGDEIKESEKGHSRSASDKVAGIHHLKKSDRTDSEVREATDGVPPLNSLHPGSLARALSSANKTKKPGRFERQDSAQWSDRDFMDSDGESDADRPQSEDQTKRASGGGWKWTEAIAGKGATSPQAEKKGTNQAVVDSFLDGGPGLDGVYRHRKITSTHDDAALQGVDITPGSLGLGRSFSREGDGSSGVVEQVVKLSIGGEHRGA